MWQTLLTGLRQGNIKALARAISLVENEAADYEQLLAGLPASATPVIGITGAPGAGKSTLTDALIECVVNDGKRVAVLCVDPSSPFNFGALLGDRIRMNQWYAHPQVYIRSLASRGSMGGLHPKIIEVSDVVKAAPFDYIIIETVGVGQSEVDVAGLADISVVVLVPEGGDEVQTMKAGLMEIADVFVINKADRPDADAFVKALQQMLAPAFGKKEHPIPVLKTIAAQKQGVNELYKTLQNLLPIVSATDHKAWLLTEKVYSLLQQQRMRGISKARLFEQISQSIAKENFNAYRFVFSFEEAAP